jgi:long-chain acyl-CoA synthetase
VAALITVDPAVTEGLSPGQVQERVQAVVDEVNADLSHFEQIKRFRILPREFTADEDEVTPTLKLKRRVVAEHFAAEIEELYRSD